MTRNDRYTIKVRRNMHDATINFKLPHEAKTELEGIADQEGVTLATVCRWAVADFLKLKLNLDK